MGASGRITIEDPVSTGVELAVRGRALMSLVQWRPRPGEAVTVCAPGKRLFRARLLAMGDEEARMLPFEEMGAAADGPEIILLQAIPEKERMETIIQKTTELGVTSILPFKSEKSISVEELDGRQRRSHNWGTVALKAARQSRRPDIPEVLPCASFEEALEAARGCALRIMLREGSDATLKDAISGVEGPVASVAVIVGPEGGLTVEEARQGKARGFIAVNLGTRVLRTETAAIFATGFLRYMLGG